MADIVYRYLGYGVTDTNGVAHLDHDPNGNPISHSYTSAGVGEVDIIASLDNPIVEDSIVSDQKSIFDALFYDEATSNAKANQYSDVTVNRSYSNDGTTLSYTADEGTRYCNTVIGATRNWFDANKKYQIEMDFSFTRSATNCACGIGFGSNAYNLHNLFGGGLSGSGHLKVTTDGNSYQIYLNDTPKGTPITITGVSGFYFTIYRTASLTFKNLKIWQI